MLSNTLIYIYAHVFLDYSIHDNNNEKVSSLGTPYLSNTCTSCSELTILRLILDFGPSYRGLKYKKGSPVVWKKTVPGLSLIESETSDVTSQKQSGSVETTMSSFRRCLLSI